MKILYTSDLHGHIDFYKEIIALSRMQGINAVILGGDLLPKGGSFEESLKAQIHFIENSFRQFLIQLKKNGDASVYIILGNDDWAATLPIFQKMQKDHLLHILHRQTFQLSNELIIVGYPYVPPTPFSPKDFEKRDLADDLPTVTTDHPAVSTSGFIEKVNESVYFSRQCSIEEDIAGLPRPQSHQKAIYVMHAPPFCTALDRLDGGKSIGSKAIRNFIDREQPAITLHGHIHESPEVSGTYWQKIGETLSINPGQKKACFSAVILDPFKPLETLNHTFYGEIKVSSATD